MQAVRRALLQGWSAAGATVFLLSTQLGGGIAVARAGVSYGYPPSGAGSGADAEIYPAPQPAIIPDGTDDIDVRSFRWADGEIEDLGTLGGTLCIAFGMSPTGVVVGTSSIAGNRAFHAFRWNEGELQDLGTLGGEASAAYDVNAAGIVVGSSAMHDGDYHAFLHTPRTGMLDLNTRIDPTLGWELLEALAVNDQGQIFGWGLQNGRLEAFKLTPDPAVLQPAALPPAPPASNGPNLDDEIRSNNNGRGFGPVSDWYRYRIQALDERQGALAGITEIGGPVIGLGPGTTSPDGPVPVKPMSEEELYQWAKANGMATLVGFGDRYWREQREWAQGFTLKGVGAMILVSVLGGILVTAPVSLPAIGTGWQWVGFQAWRYTGSLMTPATAATVLRGLPYLHRALSAGLAQFLAELAIQIFKIMLARSWERNNPGRLSPWLTQ